MESDGITWVGLDAHKKSIHVAMFVPGRGEALTWQEANEETAVRRLARRLRREAPGEVRTCYEAGPLGYALQRELEAQDGLAGRREAGRDATGGTAHRSSGA